jgi:hypothetical protein
MSKPSLEHLRLARLVIQYCNATAEEVIKSKIELGVAL